MLSGPLLGHFRVREWTFCLLVIVPANGAIVACGAQGVRSWGLLDPPFRLGQAPRSGHAPFGPGWLRVEASRKTLRVWGLSFAQADRDGGV